MLTKQMKKDAHTISDFEDMPYDDSFYEACYLVARNVYDYNEEEATEIADYIQTIL